MGEAAKTCIPTSHATALAATTHNMSQVQRHLAIVQDCSNQREKPQRHAFQPPMLQRWLQHHTAQVRMADAKHLAAEQDSSTQWQKLQNTHSSFLCYNFSCNITRPWAEQQDSRWKDIHPTVQDSFDQQQSNERTPAPPATALAAFSKHICQHNYCVEKGSRARRICPTGGGSPCLLAEAAKMVTPAYPVGIESTLFTH